MGAMTSIEIRLAENLELTADASHCEEDGDDYIALLAFRYEDLLAILSVPMSALIQGVEILQAAGHRKTSEPDEWLHNEGKAHLCVMRGDYDVDLESITPESAAPATYTDTPDGSRAAHDRSEKNH